MRHHIGVPPTANSDSSSDEDDTFSAFNRKKSKKGKRTPVQLSIERSQKKGKSSLSKSGNSIKNEEALNTEGVRTNIGDTSSNKRQYFQSSARGAKMDALLQELQETSTSVTTSSAERAPLDKMGSFVTPDEEPYTTNIFVGNLAPVTTEEELTEIFRQFGALSS